MENLCRLCSSQSVVLTPMFSIKNGRLLLDMITLICPVKIDITDTLPKAICHLCLKVVLDAVDLRERSILSDLTLRSRGIGLKIADTPVEPQPPKHEITTTTTSSSIKPEAFVDNVKVEEEPNVINFVDESQASHEDYQSYEGEQSYGDEQELTDYEPPEKMPRRDDEQKCNNCPCHKAQIINHALNVKIKEYFRRPLEKGGKWKCHICQKEYAGHLNNLKEHLSIMHKDIAQMLGVWIKPRQRKIKADLKRAEKAAANNEYIVLDGNSL